MTGFIKVIPGLKSGISRRLILNILLFSIVTTFIGTGLQLYFDFNRGIKTIHTTFKQIESSYMNSIVNSLWVTDDELLYIQMEGILQLQDIQFIEISKGTEVLQAIGTPQSESIIEHTIPLVYVYNGMDVHLGDMHIVASLKGVYSRIFDRILLIVSMQAINIFLVSLFIFIFFYQLVGKHIISMASFAESIRFDSMDKIFQLDRKLKTKKPDELEQLVTSFNLMRENLARDINRRKIVEKELQESEENLQNTFDISPSIISKANLDTGYFVEANQAVTRILGYSVEEFTSKPLMEFIHPDDKQRTVDEISKQLSSKDVTSFENRYLCKDGSYNWMAWNVTKADKDGMVTAIASDISERKIIELEIIKTKQFYENITEGVQDGIWVTDKNDVIFYANSAIEKIAGVPREQIQGNNVLKDFPEETTGELMKFYKQAQKEKRPIWYDIQVRTLANIDTWQNGWLIPQYQNKVFNGIICTIRDVTEQKEAEGDVRKLSTAVKQSPSIIAITDTEGILEYINPKFTEITGYSSSEVIGKESNILKSGKQDSEFYKELWETLESGKVWRGKFNNKKKNGEMFWEAASISAILNESGDIINYIKIGEDITQQKITEEALNTALERALESDRLKSAFLSNMSHEIRTPMNGILGFINLLNEPNLSKTQIDQYSAIINRSSDRLLNTINDIIDISKIEAGEMFVSSTEISLNNLMDELYSFHSLEANQKGLSLLLEPSTEQLTINTDSHKLHGILTNLVKNAIKYTGKGSITFGYVLKKDTEPVVTEQDRSIEVEFFVKDTGISIPEDRLQAIFNRFEQADIEDTRVFEGSGLGLAISKAYVEMLGGEIFVESEEGKGSKFSFTIPYSQKVKKEIEKQPENINNEMTKTKKLNLLIVEDDDVSAELFKTILKNVFRKTIFVKTGIDAIETCRNNPEIDLVLMDIKMPGINGYIAIREIRKFNKDLLIIAQTAYAMPGDKEKGLEVGCNDYITKPIEKKLLLEMINKHMGKESI
jgi:PAS domain S-box-containing protein